MVRLLIVAVCSSLATLPSLAQTVVAPVPVIPENLKQYRDVQAGTPIGSLQSWIVSDGQRRRIAVTTREGITIVGDVLGPKGQDLSSALLALAGLTNPSAPLADVSASPAMTIQATPPASATQPTASAAEPLPPPPVASSAPPLVVAKAQTLDELYDQATDISVNFSAGQPKPGAPVIYMLSDPTCPHCAVAIDKLAEKVQAGDIDLRIVLLPIRSQTSVYEAASILQSQDAAADFMSHELAQTRSSPSTLKVLAPQDIDAKYVRALQRNVEWARENGVQGVPFWIYKTAAGTKVDFGEAKDEMLNSVRPEPRREPYEQGSIQ